MKLIKSLRKKNKKNEIDGDMGEERQENERIGPQGTTAN